jgi:oligoendopeptidase F
MAETLTPENTSAGIRWDLTPIFTDADAARAGLADALKDARAFREQYRGRVGDLDAAELATLLAELSGLSNRLSRIGSYAGLRQSVEATGAEERDLSAAIDQGMVEAENALRFFELEWIELDDARASELAADPAVAADRHYLEATRRFAPHTRTEPEEEMLSERNPAATSAWHTLFDQVTSTLLIPFEGVDRTIDQVLAIVRDPNRERRIAAYDAVFTALDPHAPVLAHVYDSLVADRLVMDRVRRYSGPRAARDLANELPPEAVDNLIEAVERAYPIAHRWWKRKAQLLGLDRLTLADQYAPLGEGRRITWEEATGIVDEALGGFSERAQRIERSLLADGRMDAEPRQGKRGGAFCAAVAQDARPYILMNFTEKLADVMTLAHELGHAMHDELAGERQTALSHHPPLALAEVASTFDELVVFDRVLELEQDPAVRRALIAERVEGSFATIFRQTVMVRFETAAYGLRAEGKALLPDRLADFWLDANRRYYGDGVDLPDGYRLGWSYIPHFIHTRFYTYAYVFALLASLAIYANYRADREATVEPFLTFLRLGGSAAPADQLRPFGIDILAPDCWDAGLAELERLIAIAEAED